MCNIRLVCCGQCHLYHSVFGQQHERYLNKVIRKSGSVIRLASVLHCVAWMPPITWHTAQTKEHIQQHTDCTLMLEETANSLSHQLYNTFPASICEKSAHVYPFSLVKCSSDIPAAFLLALSRKSPIACHFTPAVSPLWSKCVVVTIQPYLECEEIKDAQWRWRVVKYTTYSFITNGCRCGCITLFICSGVSCVCSNKILGSVKYSL